ncbi:hypothetical protein T09_12587 [Trichinella sp. T9]|uniref:Uncharacterized protein n=1 Tax=Trichinella murrelli TaxID=144512 RepID=A0A0V0U2B1_9BILA|nr:hypothetical protein T05_3161 [Trichinella murrelli]KRX64806.1 hypothetical protein T09_12587 [Trichinella sp. T9]KRZ97268.1 hypothetical protein T08_13705 [Trichinella sp. T8]
MKLFKCLDLYFVAAVNGCVCTALSEIQFRHSVFISNAICCADRQCNERLICNNKPIAQFHNANVETAS